MLYNVLKLRRIRVVVDGGDSLFYVEYVQASEFGVQMNSLFPRLCTTRNWRFISWQTKTDVDIISQLNPFILYYRVSGTLGV